MEKNFLKRKKYFKDINDESVQNHIKIRDLFVWKNSNGVDNMISRMDKNYIRNCIAKVERGELGHDHQNLSVLSVLKDELTYREILNNEQRNNSVQ